MSTRAWRFLPLIFLGVVAPRPAGLRRLDALAVEHPRRRAGGAPAARAVEHDQMVVQPLQNAVVAQPQEPAVDRLPRREAVGQEPPGATGSEHVEDRVHDLPHRPRSRPSRQARRRQVRLQQSPLLVAHIACVTQVLAAMPPTGGRGSHEAVQTGFDNRPESHLAPAIHPRQTFRDSLLAAGLDALRLHAAEGIFFLHDGGAAAEIARRADFPIPAPNDDVILALASAHAAALIVAAAHAAPAIAVTVRADTDGGPVRPTGPRSRYLVRTRPSHR